MRIYLFLYKYLNFFCVLLLITLLCFLEVRSDFMERLLGHYLFWRNDSRQMIGRMWEFKDKNTAALEQVEEVAANLKEIKSQAMDLSTFRELFALVEKEGDLAISKNQFMVLQNNLPSELSEIFFSPFLILSLFHNSQWDRTFFIKGDMEVEVLLVNAENRVLRKTTVDREQIDLVKGMGEAVENSLDEIDEFKNRIYTVAEFFTGLQGMEVYSRSKVFQEPSRFLQWGSRLKRVGISEIARSGWIRIGYELENGLKRETVVFELDEFLVYELMDQLNPGRESARSEKASGARSGVRSGVHPGARGREWDDQ
jgi:hypothetical protein